MKRMNVKSPSAITFQAILSAATARIGVQRRFPDPQKLAGLDRLWSIPNEAERKRGGVGKQNLAYEPLKNSIRRNSTDLEFFRSANNRSASRVRIVLKRRTVRIGGHNCYYIE